MNKYILPLVVTITIVVLAIVAVVVVKQSTDHKYQQDQLISLEQKLSKYYRVHKKYPKHLKPEWTKNIKVKEFTYKTKQNNSAYSYSYINKNSKTYEVIVKGDYE